jgi:hypothetical protein
LSDEGESVKPQNHHALAARWRATPELWQASDAGERMMTARTRKQTKSGYRAREAVGVFTDADALVAAVEDLELSGFDRAAISVLASNEKVKERIGRICHTTSEAEDNGMVPRSAFVSPQSLGVGAGAAVAAPLYLAGITGAFAVAASGGTLAAVVAAALGSGAAGAGIGAAP